MTFTVVQFKKFVQAVMTTSAATIYTVPASSQDVLKCLDITNTNSVAVAFSVYLVPNAGAVANGNALFFGVTLPGYTTLHWTGTQVLNAGDFIAVVAAVVSSITIIASGLESQ